ncbi:MAG: hypothetical protein H7222_05235 [Methylotenera sp.]|nr:hypothetical protein [Oligoflexia bacterium]
MSPETLRVIHAICVIWMTSVIWIIQCIVYPSFAEVEPTRFKTFHELHMNRITWIVAPPMLLQLFTSALLLFFRFPGGFLGETPPTPGPDFAGFHFVCALALFLSTFFISVPHHDQLQKDFNPASARRLVKWNWIRTGIWTVEFGVVVSQMLKQPG